MANILKNVDKIITSAPNSKEIDLNNILYGFSATGGTESEHTDSNGKLWRVHTFTDDGDFLVTGSGLVEYVIVGGGGGGGAMHYGGGGGAGGFLTNIQGGASGGGDRNNSGGPSSGNDNSPSSPNDDDGPSSSDNSIEASKPLTPTLT